MTHAKVRLPVSDLVAALGLPDAAMVSQRVPKKMLVENAAPTVADRKLIQEQIEEVIWVASLKPVNVGVAEYRDEQRDYLELAVLYVKLRQFNTQSTKVARVAELVHRAVPYPTTLILDGGENLYISLVHIRRAQREVDKVVLDGDLAVASIVPSDLVGDDGALNNQTAFLASLALSQQPHTNLHALYQSWMDALIAWQAAGLTGRYEVSRSPEQAAKRRAALRRCHELDAQIASLRSAASKEKQMARQVATNLEVKKLLAERQRVALSL